jgi:hypothetical protein
MDIVRDLRNITKKEAINSYKALDDVPCSEQELTMGRAGIKALDYYFFHHRIKAKTKHHLSFYDALKMPDKVALLNRLVEKYKHKNPAILSRSALLKEQYMVFQLYYGTINQFRPIAAKWLYCTLKPKVGIMDFSAGWGGRCLAAMSLGIPYIGVDANTKLRTAYKSIIATYEPKAKVKMYFQPSETFDFSKHRYDLVFTSPPYFTLEEYERMPQYKSKQNFLDKFFIPVVMNAWKYLLPKGNMALNMPAEMYEAVKHILPPLHNTYELPLASRHPVAAAQGKSISENIKPRSELIYVWHKHGRATRKVPRSHIRKTIKNRY